MKNLSLEVRMTLVLGDKQMNLISEDYLMHHGVKGMKWGVRHDQKQVAKYSAKARTQRNYNAKASLNFKKKKGKAYFDDDELWNISSKEEKAEYNAMAKRSAIASKKMANHWDKAISDINKTKNKKEAKAVFNKYKNVRGNWYVYTSDPGDNYYEQMRRSK